VPNVGTYKVSEIQYNSLNHQCGRYLTHDHEGLFFELVHNRRIRDRVAASETSVEPGERRIMSELEMLNGSDRCLLYCDVVPILIVGLLNLVKAQAIRSNT
jgi:hypothetical protein